MRYYFLFLFLVLVLVVAIFGLPGKVKTAPPLEIFPDMDRQDKLMYQAKSEFFADGMASRMPIKNTIPLGHDNSGKLENLAELDGENLSINSYYYTGKKSGKFGNGLPDSLNNLKGDDIEKFILQGKERYEINCAICHNYSGDGKGIIQSYTEFATIPSLVTGDRVSRTNGDYFNTISNGFGNMSGYKGNLTLEERWAIIAYLRFLQNNNTEK